MNTTASTPSTRHEQGFELLVLRNECVEVVVVPELGGKVISLKNLRTGRDWFETAQARRLFRNKPGDDFATSTLLGWDECLPTIAACRVNRRQLADHGEVWAVPWRVEKSSRDELRLSVDLVAADVRRLHLNSEKGSEPPHVGCYLRFIRTLSLAGPVLTADYALTNESDSPEKFLWAMHPLITPCAGDRVELMDEARQQLNAPWLDTLEFGADVPALAKIFARNLTEGRAAVVNDRSGESLRFEWNTAENNALGIWLTRGGWNGCHHLALEPTNAAADSLADIDANDTRIFLAPHETKSWSVRLQLDS